jgi:hypothetical protein
MAQQHQSSLEALQDIRALMERSSRFISLSGLSGVSAGLFALAGAFVGALYLGRFDSSVSYSKIYLLDRWGLKAWEFFLLDAVLVFVGALVSAFYFTRRKAHRSGQSLWDPLARRLSVSLAVPLITGGVFVLALLYHREIGLVAPSTLIFYGLGLINASKFTLNDIKTLGYLQVALGLFGCFNIGYGLEIWALGFGVFHIVYGLIMYWKYEKA